MPEKKIDQMHISFNKSELDHRNQYEYQRQKRSGFQKHFIFNIFMAMGRKYH